MCCYFPQPGACHEDIVRFSSPDNYWCEVYERAVSHYIATSSNKKNIELTFAKAEARRELLKSLKSKVNIPVQTRSGRSDRAKVCASSSAEAKELSAELSASQDVIGGNPCWETAKQSVQAIS